MHQSLEEHSVSVIVYLCETMTITKRRGHNSLTAQIALVRLIVEISFRDNIKNEEIGDRSLVTSRVLQTISGCVQLTRPEASNRKTSYQVETRDSRKN